MGAAKSRGVQLHHPARAVSVSQDMRGELAAVRIAQADGEEVDGKLRTAVAAGFALMCIC